MPDYIPHPLEEAHDMRAYDLMPFVNNLVLGLVIAFFVGVVGLILLYALRHR